MHVRRFFLAFLLAAAPSLASAQEPVSVMIVGTFHMANPGKDIHDVHVDDVLAPKRQVEIAAIIAGLARFRPTMVDVEWPADLVTKRYGVFTKGALPPSHNEVVQLGFRLARTSGASVHGVDVDGDFPYEAVMNYAKAHGETALLDSADADTVRQIRKQQDLLDKGTISDALRWINDPANVASSNDFYKNLVRIGGGGDQPGADLLAAWYKRNAYICANIVQLAKPGARIVVIYGAGHEFLLRRCLSETPGFRLVEANGYLPK